MTGAEHVPYLFHEEAFVVFFLCRMHVFVRSLIDSPQCFLSSLLVCWTYLSVGSSKICGWSYTFHKLNLVCFLFLFFVCLRPVVERVLDQQIQSSHPLSQHFHFRSSTNKDFVLPAPGVGLSSVQNTCSFTCLSRDLPY